MLNLTAANGDEIDHTQLIGRLTDALKIDDPAAEAAVTELLDDGLLETLPGSVVALSDAGRERYARTRAAIDETISPLFADVPADDVATTRNVLTTLSDRATARFARA
ncbi:MAG: hypothetical protein JWO57_4394 [Pseudonocardiales bacterium]|nr:hypothetical protein [Pseudonocardiales bacterium]